MNAGRVLALLAVSISAGAQTVHRSPEVPKFMGREVTIMEPKIEDGMFPKGPATICVEGPPQRQCYTAPQDFGRDTSAVVVQVQKDMPALFFSATSGGTSGFAIHFALLRTGTGTGLEDLFFSDMSVSNHSEHELWTEPAISNAQIFVTADYVWGPSESHYDDHRYTISAYTLLPSSLVDGLCYYLEDRYMTVRKYKSQTESHILASEKPEILARLKRVVDAQKPN